ncbi:membrane protein [Microvirga vignae]|uniref:Membrane protein n=1 Tax=Microvirga vignae TaxID=1225564 RepID=A0A0H1R373_9HYPH|nr:membrane protein [Microvirga vignae]KLK89660.1 membrane protein [Microvirga vignae]
MLMLLAFLMGVIAGLRAMTAPAAVSWAAFFGLLNLEGTWLAFLGYRFTPSILTVLAIGELITDQLPTTPSRKLLLPFATRIIVGGLCGGAIAAKSGSLLGGLVAGALGGIVGTLGGAEGRARLAAAFGKDRPAALIEDSVAILGALLIVGALP